jgi:predicted transposase YbfD/YdcC
MLGNDDLGTAGVEVGTVTFESNALSAIKAAKEARRSAAQGRPCRSAGPAEARSVRGTATRRDAFPRPQGSRHGRGRGRTRRQTSVERRYSSLLDLDAKLFARAATGVSRTVCTGVRDVVFHNDLMRQRTNHGPKNMAAIKHMAMNLLRNATDKDSPTRRKAAAWNLKALLAQTA